MFVVRDAGAGPGTFLRKIDPKARGVSPYFNPARCREHSMCSKKVDL